ncbi:hypothetical protein Tco_0104918 [Tanacetum coccineum]
MHRTPSAPRLPNPIATQGESSAPRKPTVIRFRVRNQPGPETLIPTAAEIDIDSLDKATRLSIATSRSLEDLKAQQNMKSLIAKRIPILANIVPSQVDSFLRDYMSNHILYVHLPLSTSSSIPDLQHQLYLKMKDDEQAQQVDISIWLSFKIKFERPTPLVETYRVVVVYTHDHEDHHDVDARPEGKSSAKRQTTSEHATYSVGESSSSQAKDESNCSSSGTQEHLDEFDAWMDGFGTDDDEIPSEEVSLLEEVSGKVDELQMQNAMNDMMRERFKKEDLTLKIPKKPALVYQSCERDPKAQPMTLINQDLFYLKYNNPRSKKYVLSLHKYPVVPFPENDLEELTSRWVRKRFKRFNFYARYSVEHWKNLWAKQYHIKRQAKKRDNPDEVYSIVIKDPLSGGRESSK